MPRKNDPITRHLTPDEVKTMVKDCPYIPLGMKVVICVPPLEETSEAGIILASESELTKEHRGLVHGYLVAKGALAWRDLPETDVDLGTRVSFSRFEGRMPDNTAVYRVMNDEDIDCVVKV